ncbi:alpha/beta hydrolase [Aureispira sp. CCB-QB1]|uniref:alpha/beta hydrolase n=1 Tax=Aureispira sp. CCB-QB1 TaxID=1313421 RepID=UPI0006992071|nr:alpha/beta hydrolase [Aureispira sp. CCB-QB1]
MKFSVKLFFLFLLLTYCAFQCINSSSILTPNTSSNSQKTTSSFQEKKALPQKKGIQKKKYIDGQVYYLYVPQAVAENPEIGTTILAVIHGYTGQANGIKGQNIALKNMKRFIPYAEQHNTLLIAPHFSEKIFDSDYQRFNLDATRSDIRLIDLIQITKNTFPNLQDKKIKLFGFSGGGQFVHRFCAFHPLRVHKAVASGSGWYMWPDWTIDYPLGVNLRKFSNTKPINLDLFTQCQLLVLVGEQDIRQGSFRDDYKDFDLNNMQGNDRVSRARQWVLAMEKYAASKGLTSNILLKTVPETEHRTTNTLMKSAFNFLMAS